MLFDELCAIVRKTVGLAEPLRAALAPLSSRVSAAFVYGSVAKRTDTADSDVDLMIVADDLSYGDVFLALEAASERIGRAVNPAILTRHEWRKREAAREAFVTKVLSQPKVWIAGTEHDLATR